MNARKAFQIANMDSGKKRLYHLHKAIKQSAYAGNFFIRVKTLDHYVKTELEAEGFEVVYSDDEHDKIIWQR